ncbi:MAG: LysM peptidoglycan-binding domain-containing protein [Candidatus Omnitrophica bacterium]|nr:LysM peptidoglycan-binding domain-containing protein [Candidatus Omnitrophota bacterium]
MGKKLWMLAGIGMLSFGLIGCVQTRTYVMEKERVDQDIPGQPAPATPKTRQVVVFEVVEKDKKTPDQVTTTETKAMDKSDSAKTKVVTEAHDTVIVHEGNFTFPKMTTEMLTKNGTAAAPGAPLPETYTVQKDDTLQKISKKLYGSFSKWTKIYDANKDVIKDPNFVKPGVVLKVPALEAPAAPVVSVAPVAVPEQPVDVQK